MKSSVAVGVVALIFGAASHGFGAAVPTGSSEAAAAQAFDRIPFATTREYDDESGKYGTNYVYYFKATLRRGNAYTAWLEDSASGELIEDGSVSIDEIYAEESLSTFPPTAQFWDCLVGNGKYVWMSESEWTYDPEFPEFNDPASWTYYVKVSSGFAHKDGVRLRFGIGVLLPPGLAENPVTVVPKEKAKGVEPDVVKSSDEYKLRGGNFYLSAELLPGRKYLYALRGGTEEDPLTLDCDGIGRISPFEDPSAPSGWTWTSIVPTENEEDDGESRSAQFRISSTNLDSKAQFEFAYSLMPARTLADHDPKPLELGVESAPFTTGRVSNPEYYAYDEIVDDNLFSFSAVSGKRYAIDTAGATTNLLMRVYDKSGAIVYEASKPNSGYDLRLAFVASSTGPYYVGVAELLENDDTDPVRGMEGVTILVSSADPVDGSPDKWDAADDTTSGASGLQVVPGTAGDDPVARDAEGHGWHRLGKTDWQDTFLIGGRKDVTYVLKVSLKDGEDTDFRLGAEVTRVSGSYVTSVSTFGDINPGSLTGLTFAASANAPYSVRLYVQDGTGFDYPDYKVHAVGYATDGRELGSIKVDPKGAASATWTIDSEKTSYPAGAAVLLPPGAHEIKYGKVKGFNAPAARDFDLAANEMKVYDQDNYTDTFDHKDDTPAKATSWSLKSSADVQERTLWNDDTADYFSITGKDGQYYDFILERRARSETDTADAVFSILRGEEIVVSKVTSVHQLELPKSKEKYYLRVEHADATRKDNNCSYSLTGYFAAPGDLKFAKTAVSVKDSVGFATLTVKRTGKDGRVRIRYSTEDGTAKAGEKYLAQTGELVWENGDKKDKTISIKLIPKLRPVYEGGASWSFKVRIEEAPDRTAEEYPVTFGGPAEATVTITDASNKKIKCPEDNYKPVKAGTVKTEVSPLRAGTFFGVLSEETEALTNGFPALASLTLTVSAKDKKDLTSTEKDTLTASVSLAGKKYSFKPGKQESAWDGTDAHGRRTKRLEQVQTINKVKYTNILELAVCDGLSTNGTDWIRAASGTNAVTLTMNVPDANGKGAQTNIVYSGEVYRDFSKVQSFLSAVTNFIGYYTMALVPPPDVAGTGVPTGNGYLCMTIDNKGKAKLTGKLVDGTSVSLSSVAARLAEDASSDNGYSLYVPVFVSKKPYCLGGVLRLFAEGKDDLGRDQIVIDSITPMAWYNDNAALTYEGLNGFGYEVAPVGGYFDTVINLQRHYIDAAATIKTADVTEFPAETFEYESVAEKQANGFAVDFNMNAISVGKKSIVKNSSKLVDFEASTNPGNITIKLARATGIVSGSFSLWSQGYDSDEKMVQKEIKGIKHFGVLLLSRDEASSGELSEKLPKNVISAGFMQYGLKILDESTGKTRKWTFSDVFNIIR